ncbi:MAG: hypothetical protein LBK22_03595 [Tannerella sp.]|jgi:hypothetical protein|nr:hypothetical protein [Tannerella sp.]
MKKMIFAVLIWTVAMMAVNAQDVIYKRNGDRVNARVLEIGEKDISYKSFSNPSGPTYRLKQSDVTRIKYENGEEDVFEADAPEEDEAQAYEQPVRRAEPSGTRRVIAPAQPVRRSTPAVTRDRAEQIQPAQSSVQTLYNSGSWLNDMQYNSPRLYRSYRTGSTLSGLGMGFTLGGLTAAIIGVAVADKETVETSTSTTVYLSGPGASMFAAGIVFTVVGTPLWIVGNTKKRNAKRAYLNEYGDLSPLNVPVPPSPFLKLNSNSHGMGLAFMF